MTRRRSSGATLALVIVTFLLVIMLGIFAFIAFQLLGGGRQTESATDAGSLNVAKVAILAPTVQLNPADPTYGQVDQIIQNVVLQGSNSVNLLNFNKVVAWGLLVAANADADGNSAGKSLAKKVWLRIEGDPTNSIGAQLKKVLSPQAQGQSPVQINSTAQDVPSGPWPTAVFNSAALANSTRYANSDDGQQITWQSFETGYLGAGDSTNVSGAQITNNLPFSDPINGSRYSLTLPLTSDGFIQGYVPIKVGEITYYFVTVYHDQNPGLRTSDEFANHRNQPGADTVTLPPNSFFNHASILLKKTNTTLAVGSPATVGTKVYPPITLFPGYLVLDNTPSGTYRGPTPGACNDVSCAELGQGIYVLSNKDGGQLFSTDLKAINDLKDWIDNGSIGKQPPADGVYNYADGSSVTDISKIKGPTNSLILCTDQNSDAINANSDPICQNEYGAWNNAYHPNGASSGNATITGLIGAELAKDMNFQAYSSHNPTLTVNVTTGLAEYYDDANPITDPTANIPWGTKGVYNNGTNGSVADQFGQIFCCDGADWVDEKRIGKITRLMTVPGIFDQTTISPPKFTPYSFDLISSTGTSTTKVSSAPAAGKTPRDIAYNFFKQRCLQMGAGQAEIDEIWNNTKIDVGEVLYVYRDPAKGKLVATKTPPPVVTTQLSPSGSGLDGTVFKFYKSYNVFWNIVNAQNDFNVHDRLWTKLCLPGVIQATDSVRIETGSGGLGGSLGRLSFQQHVDNGPGPAPTVVMTGVGDPLDGSPESVLGANPGATMTGAPVVCEPD